MKVDMWKLKIKPRNTYDLLSFLATTCSQKKRLTCFLFNMFLKNGKTIFVTFTEKGKKAEV